MAAVPQLPHELLLSVGLEVVALPILLVGSLYSAIRARDLVDKSPRTTEPRRRYFLLWWAGAAVFALLSCLVAFALKPRAISVKSGIGITALFIVMSVGVV